MGGWEVGAGRKNESQIRSQRADNHQKPLFAVWWPRKPVRFSYPCDDLNADLDPCSFFNIIYFDFFGAYEGYT